MPQIEALLLANHAEAHDGLLYLMGAGWTDVKQGVVAGQQPPAFHIGVGLSILVGWTETNRRHRVSLHLEREDGGDHLIDMQGDIELGRPPGAVEGSDQRSVLAFNAEVVFLQPGGYRLVAQLGEQARSVSFRVHHDRAQAQQQSS